MYEWKQTFEIPGPAELHVAQTRGRVQIQGDAAVTQITVVATSTSEEALAERLDVYQQGNGLHVGIRHNWGLFHIFSGPTPRIDLAITVPEGTACVVEGGSGDSEVTGTHGPVRMEAGSGQVLVADAASLELESGSGSVEVRRVRGAARIETGSGNVRLETAEGDVEVEVGSGDVTAVAVTGDVRIETGSGDLSVADIAGAVDLETGSGHLRASQVRGSRLSAETGGGNIELGGLDVLQLDLESGSGNVAVELVAMHPNGQYQLETSSGAIVLDVPADAGVEFKVETGSGRIKYDLPLQVQHSDRGELEATLNGGGALVSIEAGSGSVSLHPLAGATRKPSAFGRPAIPPIPEPPGMPAATATPAAPATATPIMDAIRSDAMLAGNEHIKRVLDMVQTGKLSPEQAEEILAALDEEASGSAASDHPAVHPGSARPAGGHRPGFHRQGAPDRSVRPSD